MEREQIYNQSISNDSFVKNAKMETLDRKNKKVKAMKQQYSKHYDHIEYFRNYKLQILNQEKKYQL